MPESQDLDHPTRPYPNFGKVLVTGGGGYIGTHVCLALLRAGAEVMVIDNFSNSSPKGLDRVKDISGRSIIVEEADICDPVAIDACFARYRPDAVIHLAGLKSVNASIEQPLEYYRTNLEGTLNLLRQMSHHDCKTLVFSSSATVYGKAVYLPYDEDHPVAPVNPYGRTKLYAENAIHDWAVSLPSCGAVILRYFNPVGADASGRIGEEPRGVPDNLMPYIAQVASGKLPILHIFGTDYPTRDGTAERDFIHISDLAEAHLSALTYAQHHSGTEIFNVGTGRGHTVLELLHTYEFVAGMDINRVMKPRRPGDVPSSVAAVTKSQSKLNWEAKRTIQEACKSVHAWQLGNPSGY